MNNSACICCRSFGRIHEPAGLRGYDGCSACGLIFAAQAETVCSERQVLEHYRLADPHQQVAQARQGLFNRLLDELSARTGTPAGTLLDVGCGHGYFLELAQRRGWRAFGVEIVDQAARQARGRLGGATVFHGRLRDATFPEACFNAVTLWDVLFLQADPAAELGYCLRLLAPGGVIGLRLRNARFQLGLHRVIETAKKMAPGVFRKRPDVFHGFCFTAESIHALLTRLGFADIRISNSPLTDGDPYSGSLRVWGIGAAKRLLWQGCRALERVSCGKFLTGPSLLVWARKPEHRTNT